MRANVQLSQCIQSCGHARFWKEPQLRRRGLALACQEEYVPPECLEADAAAGIDVPEEEDGNGAAAQEQFLQLV